MKFALLTAATFFVAGAVASPCQGIDQPPSAKQRERFAPAVERHLKSQLDRAVASQVRVQPADILRVFHVQGWYVVNVNDHATDDPYVFYSRDPDRATAYVTVWAGGAAASETASIQQWVEANARGIPVRLAQCFAWYVTQGQAS